MDYYASCLREEGLMEREYSLLIGALRTLNVFSENSEQIEFTYNYCAPGFSDLLKNYPVQEIAGK